MKVCLPFGPTLPYKKSEYDAESNITKRVPYKQKTLAATLGFPKMKELSDFHFEHLLTLLI